MPAIIDWLVLVYNSLIWVRVSVFRICNAEAALQMPRSTFLGTEVRLDSKTMGGSSYHPTDSQALVSKIFPREFKFKTARGNCS